MYSQAIFPDRYRACGVRLRPLTLGHALLLDRLGNPFGSHRLLDPDSPKPTFADLLLAAFVVSRPWRTAEWQVDSAWVRWWVAIKYVTRKWTVERDADGILAWYRAMWACPRMQVIRDDDSQTPERGAELLNVLSLFACRHLNCTPYTALDLRIAQLQHDFACHAEESGAVQIVEAQEDLLIELAKRDAAESEATHG